MASKSNIKSIIFDMGGVILDINAKDTFSIPAALSVLFNITTDQAQQIWVNCDQNKILTGQETPNQFLTRIADILKIKINSQALLKQWTKLSLKDKNCINWQMMDFISDLHKTYKVYILGDTVNVAQDDNLTQTLKSKFDDYFVSYEQGFKKPDKKAFLNILSKINSKPAECIFIDDTEKNIIAANQLGIKSFLYKNLKQLKSDLFFLYI